MRDPVPATPDLTDAISDARAEVAAASRQLTDRANDVFRATGAVVVQTVEQWVEAFVLGQPDRTEKLGKAGVDKLRADLVATKARLPARARSDSSARSRGRSRSRPPGSARATAPHCTRAAATCPG